MFGTYFRERRNSLGLSLRRFCRQHKFDAGNISKLERGILRPPQGQQTLKGYARALELIPESDEWHKLFELAAAGNERISPKLKESQFAKGNLTKVFRTLREPLRRFSWIKASDIEMWAGSYNARYIFSRLVRRLIHHSCMKDLLKIDFPTDESVQRPGWDGFAETRSGNAFVPAGISVWELSAEANPRVKADKDFKKRTTNPLGLNTKDIVYIAATPRKWSQKDDWCREKKRLGIWKDVRVYDSSNLEEWLELSPPIEIWLSKLLGIRPDGVVDIEEYWENLKASNEPFLKPDVYLASREQEVKQIKEWLDGSAKPLAFESHSPAEVIDFIAAYVAHLPSADYDALIARIVIVEEKEAWRALCKASSKMVLIPHSTFQIDAEMIVDASRNGHHVLLYSNGINSGINSKDATASRLSRVYYPDLEKALIESGYDREKAQRLAHQAGGSIAILQRRLNKLRDFNKPEWAHPDSALALLPILMIGGWNESTKGDQKVLSKFANKEYKSILPIVARWSSSSDPLLVRVNSRWKILSREDSWEFLSPYLFRHDLDAFEKTD